MYDLTPEQEQVIHHPLGYHARVLAVAGSGKSTTLAHHIKSLIDTNQSIPSAMLVLMFNSLARKQFITHLDRVGLPSNLQPSVHTFHSFSYQVINEGIKANLLPARTQFWLSDKAEYIWVSLKRVINDLEKAKRVAQDTIDPEQAMHAISLWKGSLTPPNRAGSLIHPEYVLVYAGFEQFRQSQDALTYDDFIPTAITILENSPALYRRFCSGIQHLIVDEYQDINLGQQTLCELLAGDRADVMVVGDDDQTIYEWRGARPNYILTDFAQVFNTKPVKDYRLSRSFRFGPIIAQCAANVIACNSHRVEKPLIAMQADMPSSVLVFSEQPDVTKELANQVQALTVHENVPPNEIIVLGRMYAQMDSLEAEFLQRKIPYRVDGQEPFFKRKEINTLLDYIRLANHLDLPMDRPSTAWLMNVANKPSRMLSRILVEKLCNAAQFRHLSPRNILQLSIDDPSFGLSHWQTQPVRRLLDFLVDLEPKLTSESSEVLSWMVDRLGYLAYFQEYYGNGESSDEKANAVTHFIEYVKLLKVNPLELLTQLSQLDTTQGKPDEELIIFTTIFRTKGLEFDYVILPQCDENLLPYLKGEQLDTYDLQKGRPSIPPSNNLENERRLFYVAITRARKVVMIGTSGSPSRFLNEIQLPTTRELMTAVEWLARGCPDALPHLMESLQTSHHHPLIERNLLEGYLPDLRLSGLLPEGESIGIQVQIPESEVV